MLTKEDTELREVKLLSVCSEADIGFKLSESNFNASLTITITVSHDWMVNATRPGGYVRGS